MQPAYTGSRPEDGAPTRRPFPFRAEPFHRLGALAGMMVLFCLIQPLLAPAQGLGRPDIFNTDNLPSGDGATTEPDAQRARFIRINGPVLTASDSPLHQPAPAELNLDESRIQLNLFDDTTLTAAIEKTLYRSDTNFIAAGVVDGWPGSRILLVVEGAIVAATINVPGFGTFQIRYAGNGLHKVIELDKSKIPGCIRIKKAPKNPRPIRIKPNPKRPPVVGTEPGKFAPPAIAFTPAGVFSEDWLGLEPPVEASGAGNTNVDVMVVYTAAARIGAGGTPAMNALIDLAMAEANDAFENSEIPVTLNLVFRGEVTYTETANAATDLTRLQNPNDGYMDAVHTWRNAYGADMVCLFTETMTTYAGLGYLMSNVTTNFSSYSFSVVRRVYAAGAYTFAHELGHNFGCAHDRQNSTSQGAFPYSYGHRFVGNDSVTYRTVMAYAPGSRIPYFSNPNVNYQGVPTGVAIGATNAADNASSISNTAPTVASFRSPVVIVSFDSSTNTVSETNGTATINVTRSSLTNTAVTVDYTTIDGTALAGIDYIATNGTLAFAAGETSKTLSIPLNDDALAESTETFLVRLSNASTGSLFTSNLTVSVTDDDTSYVGFDSAAITVAESTNVVSVGVVRTGTTNTAVTVGYFTLNSTATSGADYAATNGLLIFAAGETSKTVSVTVLNDTLAENSETFLVRLRTPTNTTLTTVTNFTVTITTNDSSIVGFSVATNLVSEGDGTITLTVNRTGTTNNTVSVGFTTTNVTASSASDYAATNGTLSFAAGETTKTFTINLTDDDAFEITETMRVVLSNPSDARLSIGTNTITITDNDASTVGFTLATNLVSETNGTLTLTVLRTGATNSAVSVDFATTNVTAVAGSDYTAANGTLSFAAGETTNTISIDLLDNDTQEVAETFRVLLSNASNTALGTATNTVTIADDDGSTLGFIVAAISVGEDTNSLTVTVTRTGATNTVASVNYATLSNGTASAGSDFRATNGILSFAAGVTTNTFALAILNDALAENSETINLRLSSPTNCSIGTSNLVVTITTNDSSILSFSVATNAASEGDGTLTLTVNRTGTTNNAVTVDFTTTNVTASSASDYSATNGTLSFAGGETSKTFTVDLTDDDTQEAVETFRVVLSNPADARLNIGTNTVTITDDDGSTVGFTTNAVAVSETNGTVTLTILRTGATNSAVTVDFTTTNVTALAGSDYGATSGTVSFAAGETTNTIVISITDNVTQEASETFQVRLGNASNTSIGTGTNTVTISDEDGASVGFTVAAITVAEETNSVTLTVVRTGSTNTEVSVNYATLTNGTATAGSDFRATNGVLSFAAGVTTNTFALAVFNDGLAENSETILLRLSNPTNCSLGTSNLTVTITTNDSSILGFSVATNLVSEGDGTLTLTVNRTGTTNNAVMVDFTTTNVTATSAGDYSATNGTLAFAAGETSKTFTVDLIDDDTQEAAETFRIVLSNPMDSRINAGTNTVTIADDDSSTVGFSVATNNVSETNGTLTLTVVRTGATNTAIAVYFATTNATALAGSDYTATNGMLSFAAGVTTNTFTLDIVDDQSLESAETFQIRLSSASNTTIGIGTNLVTIADDDAATIGFSVSTLNVAENTNNVTITVLRTGATNTVASVQYASTNGTAAFPADYAATNGLFTFGLGETSKTFTLRVIDDTLAENNETLLLRLSNVTNATLGTSTLTVTITTNDSSILSFSVATNAVSEGDGTLTLTVNRTGTTNNAVSVDFTTTNVTASSAGDYSSTNGTLSFAGGETSKTFTVALTDDDTQEAVETFRVVLSNPVDARLNVGTNTVTVTDDDGSTVGFTASTNSVSETNGTVTLTVLRTGATNTAVTVDFTTTNGTAAAGSDYDAASGTLSFAAGETTNTIVINITDNVTQEATETFQVRLGNASNTSIGTGTNTVTLLDEDVSVIGFTVAAISVAENTNSVTITVVRTGSTNTTATVNYATLTNGTAAAGSDFRATNGVFAFAAGVTTNTFALIILDDAIAENSETINLRLSNPTNCSLGTSNLVVTITTNDSSVLSFSVATNSVSEGDGSLTLTVNRTGTTNNAVSVDFTTTNVTASSAGDYSSTNGTLSFAGGETNKTFTVNLTDDDTQETVESFRIILSNPVDARIAAGTNTVTITDDDGSTVGFTAGTNSASETNGTVTLTVLRTGATNTAVTVDFTTTNGTAAAGSDYDATSGTLTFAAGETTNTIAIDITDNVTQEAAETFQVRLSNASNTSIGTGTNTVTITDEDGSTIGFAVAAISVAEETNSVTVTVVRTGSTNTAATVSYATLTNGTATAGSDFRSTNGLLSFAAGVTTNTFALAILNDVLAENSETINLRLSNPTNCSLGTSNLVVTITTNDSSILSFSVATNLVSEGDGTLTLTVNRTGTTNNAVTVDFATTNVTASSAGDYTATNGTLSFAGGETVKTFTVDLTDDDTQEAVETFRIVLSNPVDARLNIGTNTVTVTDNDISTVGFIASTTSVSETNGTLTLTVVRTGATNTAVSVDFATTNVSAVAGSDYTTASGTLSFAAGETTNTLDVAITDNLLLESSETFQVRLSNAANTSIGAGTNTVTITDDDVAAVGFAVAALSVAEDTNTITITVLRTGTTNTTVSVNYATLTNGTATAGSDYRATNGLLSFAPGVVTNTFALAIINDAIAENNETILLRLSSPTNLSLGTSNLTVTITTNDSAILSFSVATNLVSEGDGTITLTVNRTGTTNNAVTVDFTTTNVTATSAGDYSATNGTLSFAGGETSKTFTVDLTDDNTQEAVETFRVVLSNPTDSRINVATNTFTITDDDASSVAFTTNAVTVSETNGTLTLTVIRSGATNSAVTVDFATSNLTAVAGSDYVAANGTLSFAAGETTNTIDIEITDNLSQEPTETFHVRLFNAGNTSLGVSTNTVTITDEDASTVGFTATAVSVAEDTNSVTFTVVRTGSTNTAVSVNYATLTNGTATAGSDFRATNGILSFAAGVTTNTFALAVINDLTAENNETVLLRLSSPTNCSLGTTNLTVTITTNDSAILAFSVATNLVSEGDGTITLTVNRTGTTNNAVTVDFTTTNVTASSSSDYSATNGTLSFAGGETSKTFTVDLTDDDTQESVESFRVVLSNPMDSQITVGTNTFTVTDDDGSTVGFTAGTTSVSETNGTVTLTVVRAGATNTTVTVDYATTNATALAGSDYTADGGTLTFSPGETTNTITITLADNATQEPSETFGVRLSNVANSTLTAATNVVTITDDDGSTVGFTVGSLVVAENTNTVTVTVVRSGATNTAVSVNFTNLASSTATAGSDFTATNGLLSFAAGVTTNTFTIAVVNDLTPENNEFINYRLQLATNCSLGTSNLVITITTNDSAVLSWSVGATNLAEDDGTLTLTVNRTGTTNNAVSVDFTTTNVTASSASDYSATNGTLSFAAGETSKTITVEVTDDDLQEANETFRVVLSNPADATITLGTNTVSITDNDASTVAFTTNAITLVETNDSVTVTVVRSGATNTAVAVDFTTTNVTALAGDDYTGTNGTITFAPGEITQDVTILLADDLLYEGTETFRVLLNGLTNSTLSVSTNTVSLTDDDYAALGFSAATATANELDGTIELTVERTGVTNTTVSVAYSTLDLTATAGADYTATDGILTFEPGETSQIITVPVSFDDDIESPETFRVRLTSFTNAAPDTVTNVTVTLNDAFGDQPPTVGLVSITAVQPVGINQLRLSVTGPTGAPVVIEATTDFTTWTPVATNVISGGAFQWTTPIDPAAPGRYFRVVAPR